MVKISFVESICNNVLKVKLNEDDIYRLKFLLEKGFDKSFEIIENFTNKDKVFLN